MTSKFKALAMALGVIAAGSLGAYGAGLLTNGLPPAGGTQYPGTVPLTGNETVPADTNLGQGLNPASEAVSMNQIGAFAASTPLKNNALIGGDATTNLFQRATTGASQTTTVAYGGPDRWAYWSGTGTAITLSRDTTAADLPAGYQAAFKLARTLGQSGVIQVCMVQEVSSQNSYQFQSSVAELDFHAASGANFSAANANITAYIVYGTGSDEGISKLAFGLNGGGGGASAWAGQTNATAAVISLGGVSTIGRYAAVANIPATATEIAAVLCFTPVGTAGTNDYVAFTGIQLVRNPNNAQYVSSSVGYSCASIACAAFERRPAVVETELQQAYYYQITEVTGPSAIAMCRAHSVTVAECFVQFPVTMRAAPTMTYANGFATETTVAGGTLGACSAIATSTTIAAVSSNQGIFVACTATTVPAAGSAGVLYNNGGSGAIKASAEL